MKDSDEEVSRHLDQPQMLQRVTWLVEFIIHPVQSSALRILTDEMVTAASASQAPYSTCVSSVPTA